MGNASLSSKNKLGIFNNAPSPMDQSFGSTSTRPSGTGSKKVQLKVNGKRMSFDIPIFWHGERALVVMAKGRERREEGRSWRLEG